MSNDTVTCPHCKAVLTELDFVDEGKFVIKDKSEDPRYTERVFYCPKCDEEIEYDYLKSKGVVD